MKAKKYLFLWLAFTLFISLAEGQYSEEDEEDEEYEEEADGGNAPSQTKTNTKTKSSSTVSSSSSDSDSKSTAKPPKKTVVTKAPASKAPVTVEDDEYDESTTGRHDHIFNPVNNIFKNVGTGNISGIIDQALAIRTPEPVRDMVNMIIGYVFNMGETLSNGVATVFGPKPPQPSTSGSAVGSGSSNRPIVQVSLQTQPGSVQGSTGTVVSIQNLPKQPVPQADIVAKPTGWPRRRRRRSTLKPVEAVATAGTSLDVQEQSSDLGAPNIKTSKGRRRITKYNATSTSVEEE